MLIYNFPETFVLLSDPTRINNTLVVSGHSSRQSRSDNRLWFAYRQRPRPLSRRTGLYRVRRLSEHSRQPHRPRTERGVLRETARPPTRCRLWDADPSRVLVRRRTPTRRRSRLVGGYTRRHLGRPWRNRMDTTSGCLFFDLLCCYGFSAACLFAERC